MTFEIDEEIKRFDKIQLTDANQHLSLYGTQTQNKYIFSLTKIAVYYWVENAPLELSKLYNSSLSSGFVT